MIEKKEHVTSPYSELSAAGCVSLEYTYRDLRPRLLAFLRAMVRNHDVAEDLCQDTFIKALRAWNRQHRPKNMVAWLYEIARNTALDELRRQRRMAFVPLDPHLHPTSFSQDDDFQLGASEAVQRALDGVPRRYRQSLLLYVCCGYSITEIAAVLGCSKEAIKSRLFRARAYFRSAYQP